MCKVEEAAEQKVERQMSWTFWGGWVLGAALVYVCLRYKPWKIVYAEYRKQHIRDEEWGKRVMEIYELRKKVYNLEKQLEVACEGDPELAAKAAMACKIRTLKAELTQAYRNNHERNLELDAMHHIWCTGCKPGAHRWSTETITKEHMDVARQGIQRLESWWKNQLFRQLDHGDMHRYWQHISNEDQKEFFKSLEDEEGAQASIPE